MKILRFILPLVICFFCTTSASVAQRSGSSQIDPNTFLVNITDNINIKAVGLRASQTLNPAVRNLVMLMPGQSNIADEAPSAYTPTNAAAIDNLNIYDGGIYNAVDPLLGCAIIQAVGGNPILRLADNLITANLFDHVLLVPMADGGYSVSATYFTASPAGQWGPGIGWHTLYAMERSDGTSSQNFNAINPGTLNTIFSN
jgi:hypothetical protein